MVVIAHASRRRKPLTSYSVVYIPQQGNYLSEEREGGGKTWSRTRRRIRLGISRVSDRGGWRSGRMTK